MAIAYVAAGADETYPDWLLSHSTGGTVFLRNDHGRSAPVPIPTSGDHGLGERWIEALEPLHSRSEDGNDPSMMIDDVATASKPAATSARKVTFLQKESGRRSGKPGARGCRLELSSGNWEFTGAQSRDTWTPRVLQRGDPGQVLRHHLIPSRHNRVIFMPAT